MLDVRQPQLWFLYPWQGRNDPAVKLMAAAPAAIQAACLESYFEKIGSKDAEKSIRELLSSDDPVILGRTLMHISAGALPWPYEPLIEPGNGPQKPLVDVASVRRKMSFELEFAEDCAKILLED